MFQALKTRAARAGAGVMGAMALAAASAQTAGFAADSLDAVEAIVNGLVTVGVTITIALVVYKLGKKATNRV